MKLYSYQEKLVNSKSDRILINWCRGAGKDTGVLTYILKHQPGNVLLDNRMYWSMEDFLQNQNFKNTELEIKSGYINIKHLSTNTNTIIDRESISGEVNSEKYDLVVFNDSYGYEAKIKSKKAIRVITGNIHSYTKRDKEIHENYEIIEVDYKDALKENAVSLDKVVELAMENSDAFYRQFAIKDKPKKQYVSFDQFKAEALQRLQTQFMNTNDSKDTVLTRKNIIEMIKDLKTIN